jgi:hypothetical protein
MLAPLVAVVDEVDAVVDVCVFYFRVGGDVCLPLRGIVADEVVGGAGLFVDSCDFGGGIGVLELHAQDAGDEVSP